MSTDSVFTLCDGRGQINLSRRDVFVLTAMHAALPLLVENELRPKSISERIVERRAPTVKSAARIATRVVEIADAILAGLDRDEPREQVPEQPANGGDPFST